MTYYTKIQTTLRIAESADYNRAESLPEEWESAALTRHQTRTIVTSAAVPGETLDLTHFTTVYGMQVKNLSATSGETVQMLWHEIMGGPVTPVPNGVVFADDNPDTLTDQSGTLDYAVTYGALAGQYVRVTTSTTAARDGVYLVQNVADPAIEVTLGLDHNLAAVAGTDATSVLYFENRNVARIPYGTPYTVVGNIQPLQGVTFTAESGTPNIRISIFGT